jgi:hypothetical protein
MVTSRKPSIRLGQVIGDLLRLPPTAHRYEVINIGANRGQV